MAAVTSLRTPARARSLRDVLPPKLPADSDRSAPLRRRAVGTARLKVAASFRDVARPQRPTASTGSPPLRTAASASSVLPHPAPSPPAAAAASAPDGPVFVPAELLLRSLPSIAPGGSGVYDVSCMLNAGVQPGLAWLLDHGLDPNVCVTHNGMSLQPWFYDALGSHARRMACKRYSLLAALVVTCCPDGIRTLTTHAAAVHLRLDSRASPERRTALFLAMDGVVEPCSPARVACLRELLNAGASVLAALACDAKVGLRFALRAPMVMLRTLAAHAVVEAAACNVTDAVSKAATRSFKTLLLRNETEGWNRCGSARKEVIAYMQSTYDVTPYYTKRHDTAPTFTAGERVMAAGECVFLLLRALRRVGATAGARGDDRTCLLMAEVSTSWGASAHVVRLLLDSGADAHDRTAVTKQHYAVLNESPLEVALYAYLNIESAANPEGHMPAHLAVMIAVAGTPPRKLALQESRSHWTHALTHAASLFPAEVQRNIAKFGTVRSRWPLHTTQRAHGYERIQRRAIEAASHLAWVDRRALLVERGRVMARCRADAAARAGLRVSSSEGQLEMI